MPEILITGDILEAELPHRLVQTWNPLFDEKIAAEPPARLTWEAEEFAAGTTRLTLICDTEEAPITTGITSGDVVEAMGGWPMVLRT